MSSSESLAGTLSSDSPTFIRLHAFAGEKLRHRFDVIFSLMPSITDIAEVLNAVNLLTLRSQTRQIGKWLVVSSISMPNTFLIFSAKAFFSHMHY